MRKTCEEERKCAIKSTQMIPLMIPLFSSEDVEAKNEKI